MTRSRRHFSSLSILANPLGSLTDRLSSAAIEPVFNETPLLEAEISLPGAANLLSAAAGLLPAAAAGLALSEVAF